MPQPHRLAELDALRGLAASLVVLFHYTSRSHLVFAAAQPIRHGLNWGHYGVQLFFAISGFVILMTLERTGRTADFVVMRMARLFPAYWLAVLLTTLGVIALGAGELAQPWPIVLTNLTMLQGFAYLPAVDGAYWSLTVELGFYLCMWGLWRARLLGRIEAVLLGWISLKLLWWLLPALPSRVGIVVVQQYIPFFAIGICAWRVRQGARRWRQQVPVLALGALAVALCDDIAHAAVYVGLVVVMAALVSGRLGWLTQRWLLWLGAVSYPLYLVHENLGYALIARLEAVGAPPALALAMALGAALAVAHLVQRTVEQPALAAVRAGWRGTQAQTGLALGR